MKKDKEERGQESETGWRHGSIGDISHRIGYDVRELLIAGYSLEEIDQVLYGQRTLEDLLSSKPASQSK